MVFIALLIGAGFGVFVHSIVMILDLQDKWVKVPFRIKFATAMTGGIAALVAGLAILALVETGQRDELDILIYRLWLIQVLAAWGGARIIERYAKKIMEHSGTTT